MTTDERILRLIYPAYQENYFEEMVHALTYTPHGGSGYTWTRADVLDSPLDVAQWHWEKLQQARKDEAEQLRKASRRR